MRRFDYASPTSVAEASQALVSRPDARPLAGGTDLLIQMKERGRIVPLVVSLRRVGALHELSANGSLAIGAMVTCGEVAEHDAVRRYWPILSDGAELVGSIQIRNRGTVGGNVCNAAPSADVSPALVALAATAHIGGSAGTRSIDIEQFFRGPGQTALTRGEVLTRIDVPRPAAGSGGAYLRHVPRREMDIAVVAVGVQLRLANDGRTVADARVVLGAVAPVPLRSRGAEVALIGSTLDAAALTRAGEAAAADARPISDVRATADYRRELLKVYTRRVAQIALGRARANAG
ncbi:MAG: xanthine dehydrogenase family protein subunit M [Chloroflexi bacterium]|nr:xanthine dehydrogenase family protein subunit M [Chloroflexota bacterium]